MTMRRDNLLDDEERKLAAQLARIAPHGEPSADLDARILAMAERDLAGISPRTTRHRKPPRWPVWLGAAASLTVVAGLVWQLQPVLQPRETISYEAPASVAADVDPNGKRQPIDYVESAAASDAAMPPPPPPIEPTAEPQPVQARRAAPEPVHEAPAAAVAPPPAPAPPAMANAAIQADAAAAKSMTADRAMAQEVPRRPVPANVESASGAPVLAAPVAVSAAPAPAPARVRQQSVSSMQAEDAVIIEGAPPPEADRAGFDARPPITADTPEMQRAWLKRIRELRDAGDTDDARQSLAAFAKRNPKAEIPADLKPLLPAATAPSTQP